MSRKSPLRKRRRSSSAKDLEGVWDECFNKIYLIEQGDDKNANLAYMKKDAIAQYQEKMMRLKAELNEVKEKLDTVDIEKWRLHTSTHHKCGFITKVLRQKAKGELVTQAWAKFSTILHTFELMPEQMDKGDKVSTLHLCEAPGAFITCLNHFLSTNYNGVQWKWCGQTFNPYYEGNDMKEMVLDDRFIAETFGNWDFGPDFTGDLMTMKNLEHFRAKYANQRLHLVTADGSVDCSGDPGEQEVLVSMLILWEVVTALSVLSDEGNFVLKIFTVFEDFTISLLAFLVDVFENLTLIKPGPSKPGNSEVYVVCQYFKKSSCEDSPKFLKFIEALRRDDITCADTDISKVNKHVLEQILDYAETSSTMQMKYIHENIDTFENNNEELEKQVYRIKNYIASRFIDEFQIEPCETPLAPRMMMRLKHDGFFLKKEDSVSYRRGCFEERETLQERQLKVVLKDAMDWSDTSCSSDWQSNDGQTLPWWSLMNEAQIVVGKRVSVVKSSRFCSTLITNTLEHVKDTAKIAAPDNKRRIDEKIERDAGISMKDQIPNDLAEIQSLPGSMSSGVDSCIIICQDEELNGFIKFANDHALKVRDVFTVNDTDRLSKDFAHCTQLSEQKPSEASRSPPLSPNYNSLLLLATMTSGSTKTANLEKLIGILKVLSRGEFSSLVLRVDDNTLTMFYTSIFFILSRFFEEYCMIKPSSSAPHEASRYLVYRSCCNTDVSVISDHLKLVIGKILVCKEGEDVLQFFPSFEVLKGHFEEFYIDMNNCIARRQAKAIHDIHQVLSK